jgi:hypothetical protein
MEHFLMKKTTIFAFIFLLCAGVVFSQNINLSAGLGLCTGVDFNDLTAKIDSGDYKQRYTQAALGGLIFFDATLAAGVGISSI